MMSAALGDRLGSAWLGMRSAAERGLGRLYASRACRWRFAKGEPDRLIVAPQDLRSADPTRADEIIAGRFTFAGKTLDLNGISPFRVASPSPAWTQTLFAFTWLRHLRAADGAAGRLAARGLVGDFVRSEVRFSPAALDPLTTARRLICLLSQAPLALEGADRGFYRAFIRSISWQASYLMRAGGVARDGLPRLLCAIAVTQASLCMSEKAALRRRALRWLDRELDRQVLPDGCHVGRNPQAIIELILDLLPLRQSFAARNVVPPQEILGAIDRMMPMLRFFRHADGAFATFNGMGYTQTHLIATVLAYDDARGKPVQNAPHGGYQRVDAGGSVLIVDTGRPPPVALSQDAHAGTLSFEFSARNARIIVNCGAPGAGTGSRWRQLARGTAAHSTLIVDDAASARFAPATGLVGWLDRPILSGPTTVATERREEADRVVLTSLHDGYGRRFGLVHERELTLLGTTGALYGVDRMLDPAGGQWRGTAPVTLRFHLHPGIEPFQEEGPGEVGLVLPGGPVWRFKAGGLPISIEESVNFANPEGPRHAFQLVLALPQDGPDAIKAVSWSLVPDA